MAILSLVVYGSRAREDHSVDSDTDLFAITDDERYEMIVEGSTNIACYPLAQAINRAEGGDLFFMHITLEAKAIYDPSGAFDKVRKSFVKKENYSSEISNASELGFALVAHAKNIQDYYLLNKRLAWCLRTILIARSAERGCPTFSKEGLSEIFQDRDLIDLIALKDCEGFSARAYPLFYSSFIKYGCRPNINMPSDFSDLMVYFLEHGNMMGLKTARLLNSDVEFDGYSWS
ncbi:nucleotidyltransferase domain-containing protein [Pseudomonas tremae]|uniref:anti-phage Hailong system nucleotidyltransferase HalB n=1 Tax=Pseudomonas tremae TaxID=200454 RepID=UPI00210DFECC|nr:nucleotidyltransferase domain-containing protein [Pseudomonas tremae]MCQ3024738.1 nucleotidyltransferase domain-containing protein [Pseudomonas tremae]